MSLGGRVTYACSEQITCATTIQPSLAFSAWIRIEEAATCVRAVIKVDEQSPSCVKAEPTHEKTHGRKIETNQDKQKGKNTNLRTAFSFFINSLFSRYTLSGVVVATLHPCQSKLHCSRRAFHNFRMTLLTHEENDWGNMRRKLLLKVPGWRETFAWRK